MRHDTIAKNGVASYKLIGNWSNFRGLILKNSLNVWKAMKWNTVKSKLEDQIISVYHIKKYQGHSRFQVDSQCY